MRSCVQEIEGGPAAAPAATDEPRLERGAIRRLYRGDHGRPLLLCRRRLASAFCGKRATGDSRRSECGNRTDEVAAREVWLLYFHERSFVLIRRRRCVV